VSSAGFDYCEIGFMKHIPENMSILKNHLNKTCKIAGMCLIDDMASIKNKIPGLSMIRVLYNPFKSMLDDEAISHMIRLIDLNYELTVNIAYIDRITETDIRNICDRLHALPIKCIYLADTYGCLDDKSTQILLIKFDRHLRGYGSSVDIGFHAHDNRRNASTKSRIALDFPVKMIDATVSGMGRGGGNLSDELLLLELGMDLTSIIAHRERYQHVYESLGNLTLPDVLNATSGYLGIHPDFVRDIVDNKIPYTDGYNILKKLSQKNIKDYSPIINEFVSDNTATSTKKYLFRTSR
jgi:hypothetical protein